MKVFLLASFALVGFTLLIVFLPVVRRRARDLSGREQAVVSVYSDQLAELERDVRAGTLSPEAFERSRDEVQRRLLEDARAPAIAAPMAARSFWLLIVGAIFVPTVAIGLYSYLGAPQLLLAQAPPANPQHEVSMEQINQMIGKLVAHLREKPDDAAGWGMLGRTYAVLGRFPEAVEAYKKAVALKPDEARLLSDYADALATSRGRVFDAETEALLERAVKLAPDDPKVLALIGSADFQRKAYPAAIDHWERAIAKLPADSEFAQQLQRAVADARQSGGIAAPPGAVAAAAPPAAPAAAGTAEAADSSAAPAPKGSARVQGRVTLSASLSGKPAPDDTVFVFARAAEGPRMPLAILKKTVRDLPFDFVLDDTMGMAAGMNLSRFPKVVVGARISKSGQAMPQSGDLEGLLPAVSVGATGLVVEINRAVP